MKEERQDLNEKKHQDQKDHDVNGEKSVRCSIKKNRRQKAFQLFSVWKHLQT